MILTFTPVSRPKTMDFVKWLGVSVPKEAEELILNAGAHEKDYGARVDASVDFLCGCLRTILQETAGIGIPLGISCESVSIFRSEIDGVHELFRKLQTILLDTRGSPWKVEWFDHPLLRQPPSPLIRGNSGGAEPVPSEQHRGNRRQRLVKQDFMDLVQNGVYSLEELVSGTWWTPIRVELEEEAKAQQGLAKKKRLTEAYDTLVEKEAAGILSEEERGALSLLESLAQ